MTEVVDNLTEQEKQKWVSEQFARANKHLAENAVIFDSVAVEQSRYLVPFVAIWKINALDKKSYWVISGDLPVDYTLVDNAKDARSAMHYFSMSWQLRAENIISLPGVDNVQADFAKLLVTKAEVLYQLYNNEQLWQHES